MPQPHTATRMHPLYNRTTVAEKNTAAAAWPRILYSTVGRALDADFSIEGRRGKPAKILIYSRL